MKQLCLASSIVISVLSSAGGQTTRPWTQLSLSTCGVDEYRKAYAQRDGRGVVIAVIDTGVDVAVPGLDKMPDGSPKVIDVQDFCGQGDVALEPAVLSSAGDRIIRYAKDGAPQEFVPPPAERRPPGSTLWTGVLAEKAFLNTDVPDVNDNGRKDDEFAVLVVVPPGAGDDEAVAYIDVAGERDFSKAKPLRNYRVAQEYVVFPRPRKEQQLPQLPVAVNIFPRQRKLVVHFDDGGHGTHVAGIAAGWRINGQDGFDGVAPGAKIISLKIGHGALSGGATTTGAKKRAFEYAARYAREKNVPVVCNLSYGVGSEREGYSDIDTFLDKLCRENPNLIVCTSAGNAGPGLSSVGTPAAAELAISAAALMAADTARDVWGCKLTAPAVAWFSSRGGEISKPDLATPGYSTSTVTTWNRSGDFFSGTSMASPYAAGMAAVLVCDAMAELGSEPPVRSSWVKAALQRSARPIAGYTMLDFGAGVPDLTRAAQLLRELIRTSVDDPLVGFRIRTESPMAVEGEGPTSYWRSTHLPTESPRTFTIEPVFAPSADAAVRRSFTRRYEVRSTARWLQVEQTQVYFRAEQSIDVRVKYDGSALTAPGLYTAAVELAEGDTVAHRLWNTIVVPYRFGPAERYRREFRDQRVFGWQVQRYYVAVPTGATAMHLELRSVDGKTSTAAVRGVFRPNGNQIRTRSFYVDTQAGRTEAAYSVTDELSPGVWEVCVQSRRPDEESFYSLSIRFDGVAADPPQVASWERSAGAPPAGEVTLHNTFEAPTPVTLSGRLEGFRKTQKVTLTPADDTAKVAIKLDPAIGSVRVRVETSEKAYAMFTDVAVNLLDSSGKALHKDGMNDRRLRFEAASPGGSASCELEIRAAFTYPDSDQKAEFDVTVDHLLAAPLGVSLKRGDSSECVLYPGIAVPLSFKLAQAPPLPPEGLSYVGYLRATCKSDGRTAIDVPLVVKP